VKTEKNSPNGFRLKKSYVSGPGDRQRAKVKVLNRKVFKRTSRYPFIN
jgi:hypothetical protein